jgi:MFS family permease
MDFNFIAPIFIVSSAIISYLFLSFRDRTTKKNMNKTEYKIHIRGKILTVFFYHLLFIFGGSLIGLFVFLLLVNNFNLSLVLRLQNVYLSLFFLCCLFITYGSGVYLTAVISEKHIKNSLSSENDNPILRFYNDYFHGPFSHVLSFTGFGFLMLVFSATEIIFSKQTINPSMNFYPIYGFLFGIMYFYWLVKNLTWKHQTPWFILILSIYAIFTYHNQINILTFPLNTFNLFFLITINFCLVFKYFFYKKKKGDYRYNFKLDKITAHLNKSIPQNETVEQDPKPFDNSI